VIDLLPPFLDERPWPVQFILAWVVPMAFGFLCGAILDSSATVYLALQVVAAIGGYLAGFDHDVTGEAGIRGLIAGLLYGEFILIGHHVVGGDDHNLIADPEAALIVVTGVLGALLGMLGTITRTRIELGGPSGGTA
jgi:hypothetical protein